MNFTTPLNELNPMNFGEWMKTVNIRNQISRIFCETISPNRKFLVDSMKDFNFTIEKDGTVRPLYRESLLDYAERRLKTKEIVDGRAFTEISKGRKVLKSRSFNNWMHYLKYGDIEFKCGEQ